MSKLGLDNLIARLKSKEKNKKAKMKASFTKQVGNQPMSFWSDDRGVSFPWGHGGKDAQHRFKAVNLRLQ